MSVANLRYPLRLLSKFYRQNLANIFLLRYFSLCTGVIIKGGACFRGFKKSIFLHACLSKLSKNVSLKFQKQTRNIFGVTEEIVSKRRAGIRAAKLHLAFKFSFDLSFGT